MKKKGISDSGGVKLEDNERRMKEPERELRDRGRELDVERPKGEKE
jgi:hypothetical protein